MALSKKGKKILVISSISIGAILLLGGIFFVINLFRLSQASPKYNGVSLLDEYVGSSVEEDLYLESSTELESTDYEDSEEESKIRKSGSINITTENLDTSSDTILDISDNYNSSIVSSYESGEGNYKTVSITLKIPALYFEDVYQEVKDIDGEVTYASYSTDDVTMEYTDLESRLGNLEAAENQLVEILSTAQTVEDTLAVYNQLTSTRSQIEVIKGQLKYLDSQVDYSYLTINLSLSDVGKEVADEKWEPLGVFKNAFAALLELGTSIVDALIWVLVFSPVVLIPVVIILYVIKKKAKKKK